MPSSKPAKAAHESGSQRDRAVLVGVQLPGVTDADHAADLAELGRLVSTLGYDVGGDGDAAARRAGGGGGARRGQAQGARGAHGRQGRRPVRRAGGEDEGARAVGQGVRGRARDEGRRDESSRGDRPRHRRRRRPRDHAEPGAQPRARDRGARCSIARASSSTSSTVTRAAARRGSRSRSRASTTSRRGCASRRAARSASAARARARRRSSSIAARSATASPSCASSSRRSRRSRRTAGTRGKTSCASRSSATPTPGKSSLMRALTGQPGARRGQALRDARHDRARAAAGDEAAHPGLGHGRASSRSCRTISSRRSGRRSTRRSRPRSCSTSSTPPIPTHEAQLEVTRERAARDRRRRGAEHAALQQGRSARRGRARGAARGSTGDGRDASSRRTTRTTSRALRQTIVAFFEAKMVEEELVVPYAKQALARRGLRERAGRRGGVRRERHASDGARASGGDRAAEARDRGLRRWACRGRIADRRLARSHGRASSSTSTSTRSTRCSTAR